MNKFLILLTTILATNSAFAKGETFRMNFAGGGNGTSISPISADTPGIYTWNGAEHGLSSTYNGQSVRNFGNNIYDSDLRAQGIYETYWVQGICSSTSGTVNTSGHPMVDPDGSNCWCRLKRRSDDVNGDFVLLASNSSAADCATTCADTCAYHTSAPDGTHPFIRPTMLSSFQ